MSAVLAVDALAVMDSVIESLLGTGNCDPDNPATSDAADMALVRAAVSELIEAAKPFGNDEGPSKRGDDWMRLVVALAKVQGVA